VAIHQSAPVKSNYFDTHSKN